MKLRWIKEAVPGGDFRVGVMIGSDQDGCGYLAGVALGRWFLGVEWGNK